MTSERSEQVARGALAAMPTRRVTDWGWCPRHRGHIMVLAGLCVLGLALIALGPALTLARSAMDERLDHAAKEDLRVAPAIVERVEQSPHSWVDGSNVYCLPYSFHTERNHRIQGSSLTRDSWLSRDFFDGTGATVEYLADDPQTSRIQGTRWALTMPLALLVPAGIAYLAWVLVVCGLLRAWSYRRLFATGQVAPGRVERVISWSTEDHDPCWASVVYRYELPGDRPRTGRALVYLPWRRALREDMAFPVLVQPTRPGAHLPMGLYGLRLG